MDNNILKGLDNKQFYFDRFHYAEMDEEYLIGEVRKIFRPRLLLLLLDVEQKLSAALELGRTRK